MLAFAHFGGVPARIRYDNLKPAVIKVLNGRNRTESDRFVVLRSHYGFDSFFCRPGKDGAHEKGGVEGEIGRFRRRHLVPVPSVTSLAELNRHLAAGDVVDDARTITGRSMTVAQAFAVELPTLQPLPDPPRGVPLLFRHVLVSDHPAVNDLGVAVNRRMRPGRVLLTWRGQRRRQRLPHRAPMNTTRRPLRQVGPTFVKTRQPHHQRGHHPRGTEIRDHNRPSRGQVR